jgi:hypothetical protein
LADKHGGGGGGGGVRVPTPDGTQPSRAARWGAAASALSHVDRSQIPARVAQVAQRHKADSVNQRNAQAVIDERVPQGTNSAAVGLLTSIAYNASLGRYNGLSIEATFDDIRAASGDSHMFMYVEHSSDGTWWLQRSNQNNTYASSDADIALLIKGSSPGPASVLVRGSWCDAANGARNKGPLLAYVRLRVFTDATALEGHVRVFATSHDNTAQPIKPATSGTGS